jgi:hypothetical protein
MRKVMTVVPVLMTSCQVSLKLKIGPVTAQITTTAVARKKMAGFPQKSAAWRAKRPNHPACWDTRIFAEFVLFFFMHRQNRERPCQSLPSKTRIKRMTTTSPRPPPP